MISQQAYDEALADDVYGRLGETSTAANTTEILSYFEDAMVYQVLEDLMTRLGCTEEEAWQLIYRGDSLSALPRTLPFSLSVRKR